MQTGHTCLVPSMLHIEFPGHFCILKDLAARSKSHPQAGDSAHDSYCLHFSLPPGGSSPTEGSRWWSYLCPVVTGYRLMDYSSYGAGAPWFLLLRRGGRGWGPKERVGQPLNISLSTNSWGSAAPRDLIEQHKEKETGPPKLSGGEFLHITSVSKLPSSWQSLGGLSCFFLLLSEEVTVSYRTKRKGESFPLPSTAKIVTIWRT